MPAALSSAIPVTWVMIGKVKSVIGKHAWGYDA